MCRIESWDQPLYAKILNGRIDSKFSLLGCHFGGTIIGSSSYSIATCTGKNLQSFNREICNFYTSCYYFKWFMIGLSYDVDMNLHSLMWWLSHRMFLFFWVAKLLIRKELFGKPYSMFRWEVFKRKQWAGKGREG